MEIKNLKEINEVFKRLNNLRRWTNFITESKYDEISKQALNCCVCFILATEAEERGIAINWKRFPKIAIYRAFQKAYVNYDTPEHILKEICKLEGIDFGKAFGDVTFQTISELTDNEFAMYLKDGCGTVEEKIYKAATKVATLLELIEIQKKINGDYVRESDKIVNSMSEFEDIPGFNEIRDLDRNYFKVFSSISKLRNQNRWAAYSYSVECSVLGHLFDTAVFSYFLALEDGKTEEVATKCFFMGIFHDVPEAFTKDIPSPIKDKIPGFRKLTEIYELKMMEKNVYPFVSEICVKALKDIMFEESDNADFKALMKGADYMSAISEIWRQLKAGTRDEAFINAIMSQKEKFDTGVAKITPNIKMLLGEMVNYATRLNL